MLSKYYLNYYCYFNFIVEEAEVNRDLSGFLKLIFCDLGVDRYTGLNIDFSCWLRVNLGLEECINDARYGERHL